MYFDSKRFHTNETEFLIQKEKPLHFVFYIVLLWKGGMGVPLFIDNNLSLLQYLEKASLEGTVSSSLYPPQLNHTSNLHDFFFSIFICDC